jgi:hypothetical protein
MIWGSLIDCLTTTPELESEMVAVSPYKDFKKAEARLWRDGQLKAHKIVVTQETRERANYAVEMLLSKCKASAEIFEKSKGQVVVTGKSLGCNLKGLVDLVLPSCTVLHDLKTTASFSESGFSKTIADRGYHCQGGLYLPLWNAMHPEDQRDGFEIIWQDSKEPFEVAIDELPLSEVEAGTEQILHLLEKVVNAAKEDRWPMKFEGRKLSSTRPVWAARESEAKMNAERNDNE